MKNPLDWLSALKRRIQARFRRRGDDDAGPLLLLSPRASASPALPPPAPEKPRRRRKPATLSPPVASAPAASSSFAPAAVAVAAVSTESPVLAPPPRKPATLALQGGGAHGAFTWGVLDRLLADGRLRVTAVSGASAGAMNAVMLAQGLGKGGDDGARAQLDAFWRRIADAGRGAAIGPSPLDRLTGNWNLDASPGVHLFEAARRWFAPYDLQPQDYHPLRKPLGDMLDPAAVRAAGVDLYVAAADVGSGRLRLFRQHEIGVDALLASACLPHLFQAVRIDGRDYWDGGYLANPALFPLIAEHGDDDLILVTLNPFDCPDLPKRPDAINARLSQIAMNAPLIRELDEIRSGRMQGTDRVRLHRIAAEDALRDLGHYSRLSADWGFLTWLRDVGRDAADRWLSQCGDRLGTASTFDPAADPATEPKAAEPKAAEMKNAETGPVGSTAGDPAAGLSAPIGPAPIGPAPAGAPA